MFHKKLVRDKIPQILKKQGLNFAVYQASLQEYKQRLKEKLLEESNEFLQEETLDELADILEVILAFARLKNKTPAQLEQYRKEKASKNGSFKRRLVLQVSSSKKK